MKDSWWANVPVLIDADCPGGVVATVPVRLDVVATDPVLFPFLGVVVTVPVLWAVGNRSCPLDVVATAVAAVPGVATLTLSLTLTLMQCHVYKLPCVRVSAWVFELFCTMVRIPWYRPDV